MAKTVVITGTSKGIGLEVAKKFIIQTYVAESTDDDAIQQHCFNVIGIDVLDCPIELANYLNYTHYKADVRGPLPDISDVYILINNAGVQNSGTDIDINLKGTINCTEKYGIHPGIHSIVNVSSVSAHNGAEFPEYCASKGGQLAYTVNTAKRIAQFGATCNSISPGGVITELNSQIIEDSEKWAAVMQETPLKKWATAEEIAEWIYFITVINKSMTGQDILIDNGEMINHNFIW